MICSVSACTSADLQIDADAQKQQIEQYKVMQDLQTQIYASSPTPSAQKQSDPTGSLVPGS